MIPPRVRVPVVLDLSGSRILFVGAGEGTRTKLAALADQNPSVRIVAPVVSAEVRILVRTLSDAQVLERPFTEGDLEGVALVYGMTDDPNVNARLTELCRQRGLWSNVAHHRGTLAFTSPAVARKDGVVAAFSSETSQPAVAVAARDAWVGGR